jgi:hypothetical protein
LARAVKDLSVVESRKALAMAKPPAPRKAM